MLQVSHVNCSMPTGGSTDAKMTLVPNVPAIIEEFHILGNGLVKSVDTKTEQWSIWWHTPIVDGSSETLYVDTYETGLNKPEQWFLCIGSNDPVMWYHATPELVTVCGRKWMGVGPKIDGRWTLKNGGRCKIGATNRYPCNPSLITTNFKDMFSIMRIQWPQCLFAYEMFYVQLWRDSSDFLL